MEKCALVCGAGFAREDFCTWRARGEIECVVAVDSGYEHLYELNIAPDVAIGDFDSLGFVPDGAVVSPAIKDKSDLELALDWAREHGFRDIIVYGCLGARIDHTIASLQTLARVAEGGTGELESASDEGDAGAGAREGVLRGRIRVRAVGNTVGSALQHANKRSPYTEVLEVLAGPATLKLSAFDGTARCAANDGANEASGMCAPDYAIPEVAPSPRLSKRARTHADRVSSVPAPETLPALGAPTYGNVSVFSAGAQARGVTLQGMYYPLDEATLSNRTSLGLSNEMVEQKGSVSVREGMLYVVYPASFHAEVEFLTDFERGNQK